MEPARPSPHWKLPRRFLPFAFALYMAAIMAFLMCCAIVAAHAGLGADYWRLVLKAYLLAMPIGFFCVLLVRPLVSRLVAITVQP